MQINVCLAGLLCGASLFASAPRADLISTAPVIFEPADSNPAPARYLAKGLGYHIEIQPRTNTLTWKDSGTKVSVRTQFLRARRDAHLQPLEQLSSHTNYFIGNSPRRWRTNVPNFAELRVDGLYAGIDLVYRAARGTLEYDFVLHPGADPQAIEFEVGADAVRVDSTGDLVLRAFGDHVRWKAPQLYQDRDGTRVPVTGGFEVSGRRVRFRVDAYDRSRPLVIDPTLSYSSYLGGSANEEARQVTTDSHGNIYLAGTTTTSNFSLPGGFQTALGGPSNAFVAKFNAAGKLVYLSYLGGNQYDVGTSVAVDAAGNIYVGGMTSSFNFPVTEGAFQTTYGGGGGNACEAAGDAFVTKLNPTGSALIYSTYVGGRLDEFGSALTIDAAGDAYITGYTLSNNFPVTPGAFQTTYHGSGGQRSKPVCNGVTQAVPQPWFVTGDAFVTKLNPSGTGLVFSTYLGGSLDDVGLSIALDISDNVLVGGFTLSPDFPVTAGAVDNAFGGSEPQNEFFTSGDGFLTKLAASGASLIFSTYLGGAGDDAVTSVSAAADGTSWATGFTSSLNFPVSANALQSRYGGYYTLPFLIEDLVGDAFATGINATGTALVYSTYLGGSANDMGTSIAVDSAGLVYVVGFSDSQSFPVSANALQPRFAGDGGQAPYFHYGDGFVAVIDPVAPKLIYSSYFGGAEDDQFWGLALDGSGGVWATGNTMSTNLPVTANAWQPAYGGYVQTDFPKGDSILVHFTGFGPAPTVTNVQNGASFASAPVAPGSLITIFGTFPGTSTTSAPGLPLPPTLGGAAVMINDAAAPLNFVNATQVNTQVPWDTPPGPATATVTSGGVPSAPFQFTVGAAGPGIFTFGSNHAVAQNSDYTLNNTGNGAAVGSFVIVYMTGGGAVDPTIPTGAASLNSPISYVTAHSSATIGDKPADILFLGMAPYFVGVVQADVKVPSLSSGDYPVVITIGGAESNAPLVTVSGK
jgi:uncharacterized protein (TIGR03437 family)